MTTDDEQLLREMWCAYTLHATPMPFSVREAMTDVLAVVRAHDSAALAQFGRWCLTASRHPVPGDIDGGALQGEALRLGLLEYVTVTEPCGEDCACTDYYGHDEWPHECLRETGAAMRAEG